MKKVTLLLSFIVLFAAVLLVGCDGSDTVTDMDGASTTTMPSVATTMPSVATTMPESPATTTGEGATGGVDIPEAMPGAYVDLTPEQAKQLIESMPETIIVDVSPVYDQGHLPGAVNYYGGDGTLAATIPSLDPDATYLVYCHAESASRAGAQALVDAGFTTVYRLQGDYDAWVAAGYPIEM